VPLSRDVVIRILGESDSAVRATRAAANEAGVAVGSYQRAEREYARQQDAMRRAAEAQRDAMATVGKAAATFGAVVAAGLALSTKAAIDWESAWAGVTKTVDGTPQQMQELEDSLRGLAKTLPATHEEIAGVAEAAGQLGIARGDIVEFTKVAIAMGVSTNLSSEDAATGLARLSNIMGTSSKDVDRLGSVLVGLGNAGASTEGEILAMGLRIAAAGRQAKMSEGDVLGIANAMSSLGIEAEAGGTAISTVIKDINGSVLDGSKSLVTYADLAGMTASQFAQAWRDDAAGALVKVVDGLGQVGASGGNVNSVLGELGMTDIRVSDTLLRLSGNSDLLASSLSTGNEAWAENSALMNEANQRYETSASKIAIAKNNMNDAAITIGDTLLPALATGAGLVADFAAGWEQLPDGLQTAVVIIGGAASAIGLLGGGAALAAPKLAAFRAEMLLLEGSSGRTMSAVGKFGTFMTGPWGMAIGVATLALGGLVTWLGKSSEASEEAVSYQDQLAEALRTSKGAIDDNIRAMAAQQAEDSKFNDSSLLEWAERVGVEGSKVTDALLGNRAAYEEITKAIDTYAQAQLDAAIASGTADTVDLSWVPELKGQYEGLAGSMGGAVAENERLAAASKETGAAADETTPSLAEQAGAMADAAVAGQDAADAAKALTDALDGLNGPTLDVNAATRDYQAALDAVEDQLKGAREKADGFSWSLDVGTEAGRNNQAALDDVAKSAIDVAKAVYAADGDYGKFRGSLEGARQDLFNQARQFFDTEQQAWDYVDSVLAIPDEATTKTSAPGAIDAKGQVDNLAGSVRALPDGQVDVTANTSPAERALFDLINKQRTVSINARASLPDLNGSASGSGRPGLATGGRLSGPGTGTSDSILGVDQASGVPLAWVSNREFVVNERETDRNIALIEAINAGQLPPNVDPSSLRYLASGGRVFGSTAVDVVANTAAAEQQLAAFAARIAAMGPRPGAGGPLGSGYQALYGMARSAFPGVVLTSGFRPGDPGYHGKGRAADLGWAGNDARHLAAINRWWYDNYGSQLAELIYDGPGDDRPDIKDGRPHTYNAATRAEHGTHVHTARDRGGPVRPGQSYLVGETAPELFVPNQDGQVFPAALTERVLSAIRQPAAAGTGYQPGAINAPSSYSTPSSTSYSRTFAPQISIVSPHTLTARQVLDAARDEEFLHGG
jgi:TP901 family phage tail tape measure protein